MPLRRNREVKNPNRKDMKVLDMSFPVSKENQRLLKHIEELKRKSK